MLNREKLNGGTLYVTPRSSFARRVRLAFHENGIEFREVMLDLIGNPHREYLKVNPLKKVPAWRLASGEVIVDSNEILSVLYATLGDESPLAIREGERIECALWSGLAIGICERVVEHFFESLRPESQRDPELVEEVREAIEGSLALIEKALTGAPAGRKTLVAGGLRQADLDVGTALEYLSVRYSGSWVTRYPACAAYLAFLSERPSFQKTKPPKA